MNVFKKNAETIKGFDAQDFMICLDFSDKGLNMEHKVYYRHSELNRELYKVYTTLNVVKTARMMLK